MFLVAKRDTLTLAVVSQSEIHLRAADGTPRGAYIAAACTVGRREMLTPFRGCLCDTLRSLRYYERGRYDLLDRASYIVSVELR
jgi:hypothetical protein